MKQVIAIKDGVYRCQRYKEGDQLEVADNFNGSWFVSKEEYRERQRPEIIAERLNAERRKSESFVSLMETLGRQHKTEGAKPKVPETEEQIRHRGRPKTIKPE